MSKNEQEQFFTRKLASAGTKLPLISGDGKKTKHWLMVRGVDSDEWRIAEQLASLRARELILSDASLEEKAASAVHAKRIMLAALVCGWSFEGDCTPENVIEFFDQCSDEIIAAVDSHATNRELLFKKK